MQPHDTPYFPENITDYAPWVAKYGLYVPYGECQCGCGESAPISSRTITCRKRIKGHPTRFIPTHFRPMYPPSGEMNPSGLCECGCGQPAPISKNTDTKQGYIKGQPRRFIAGHANRVRPKRSIEDRFWEKVDKRGPDECWEWTGSLDRRGYGKLSVDNRPKTATRVSYELHNGPIPDGMEIMHSCDNPPCVNPAHLVAGTHLDNMQDCKQKGRYAPAVGERASGARFTNEQVREMRQEFAVGNYTITEFARMHDASPNAMRAIIHKKSYPNA